jgi:hypothetical protein
VLPPTAGIAISTVTNGADFLTILAGTPVTWTYTVRNTGNVGLSGVVVADDHAGVVPVYSSGDLDGDGILDVGETWTYTASGNASAGNYSNVGNATGRYMDSQNQSQVVAASDPSGYLGAQPGVGRVC